MHKRLTSESLRDAAISKRLTEGVLLAALVAVFLLLRPYRGIVGDSMLYLGWAAAGLDPDGIGRDPMWALDGQMRFSLFPFIARRLIAASSIDFAGMSLALLGVILWACGLIALVRALGEQRSLAAIMIACAAFPAEYGLGFIFFGEPLATPRVFAESATLFSLGRSCTRPANRRWRDFYFGRRGPSDHGAHRRCDRICISVF